MEISSQNPSAKNSSVVDSAYHRSLGEGEYEFGHYNGFTTALLPDITIPIGMSEFNVTIPIEMIEPVQPGYLVQPVVRCGIPQLGEYAVSRWYYSQDFDNYPAETT